jgi:membrane protein required for colicin V production
MNWLDAVIIIGLILLLFAGLKAGLIKMLFLVVGVIIGVTLAGRYSDGLADAMSFIGDPVTAGIIAFIIILVATILVAMILAFIVERIVHWAMLGWLDSLGGAILGLLLGAIFIGAILAMCYKYLHTTDLIAGSALGRFLLDKFGIILGLLPAEFQGIHYIFF